MKKLFKTILSFFYVTGVKFRHFLFEVGLYKSKEFATPVICVGNITVGGTGKTPMSELLIAHFSKQYPIALISRGYGRRTKGYREVSCDDSYQSSGDEPLQMKRKFPETLVVVCEKRARGIERIEREHPEVQLIIMDDGFQHRYVKPMINILMVDFTRPVMSDKPLPLGTLRDSLDELHRGDYFIVTKCPERLTQLDERGMRDELISAAYQSIYFTRIKNLAPEATYPSDAAPFDDATQVIALSGIGNPKPFLERIEASYNMVDKMIYGDHHSYTRGDIRSIQQRLEKYPEAIIITTEKDSVKFLKNKNIPDIIKQRLYFTSIEMEFVSGGSSEDLLKNLERNVREYKRGNRLHY